VRSRRARALLAVAGALALTGAGCSPRPDPSILRGTIIVGVADDAPGFAESDINPSGFDIDLMNAVGAGLNTQVTHTPITSADRAAKLKTHQATIVIDTYSITGARNRDGIDFAGPYMVSTEALLVRGDDKRIAAKDSLRGKSVCTVGTTTGAGVTIPGAIMGTPGTTRPTTRACVDDLLKKNTDAVFTDSLLLYGYAHAYRGRLKVVLPGVFGENQYYGIGLLAHHRADCLKLNQVIKDYLRTQWRRDFQDTLPAAVAAAPGSDTSAGDFESVFKPTNTDMTRLSCKL
jgi:glutamate transport system substrate-binding protein